MTYWVHVATDGLPWYRAKEFDPPIPKPVPGKGWPVFLVEIDRFTFRFASMTEIDACLEILSRKVMPTTRRLSALHGTQAGPNSHWLSRLPKGTKSWRYRQEAVRYLQKARAEFASS